MRIDQDIEKTLVHIVVTMDNVVVGARVKRGPDWQWWDQDGGGEGVITNYEPGDKWVAVKWDMAYSNKYRVDVYHDLIFA